MRAVVIGAGLAGLVAATRLARGGAAVTLVTKGLGGLPLSQGTVDIWGYRDGERVSRPLEAVASAPESHPYAAIGVDAVRAGLAFLGEVLPSRLVGDPQVNVLVPTAVGVLRPTCLTPPSMASGALPLDDAGDRRWAVVGFQQLKDFPAALVAGNLNRTPLPGGAVRARPVIVGLPARRGETDSSALVYARAVDEPGFLDRLVSALGPRLELDEAVALPAMLGLRDADACRKLAERLGRPVFEIPLPPPSVPGLRMNDALTAAAKRAGVRFMLGSPVVGARTEAGAPTGAARMTGVTVGTAGHPTDVAGDAFLLAAGGFESGALELDSYGHLFETVLGLPVVGPEGPAFGDDFWTPQPLFASGVRVAEDMRVVTASGELVHENLYAAGGILAGAQRWQELSGDGIALGSAVKAADAMGGLR